MRKVLSIAVVLAGALTLTACSTTEKTASTGAIAGAVIGGGWGNVIAQGSQFGLGTWLMKYSREYEKQADLLGAQIMARAGYDPRDLARMFETIQRESKGSGGPEWLSSHPDPGNRSQYIVREAEMLQIARRPDDGRAFETAKVAFSKLPAAASMSDPQRANTDTNAPQSVGTIGQPVPPPDSRYRTARGGKLFEVSVPANWQAVASNSSVKYVPQNAYGAANGTTVLTHGVELGVTRAPSRDLGTANGAFVDALLRSNPDLRITGPQRQVQISRRAAVGTELVGRSATGGNERVGVYTTFLADGNLFYYLTIVPDEDAREYGAAFDRVGKSIRLLDAR